MIVSTNHGTMTALTQCDKYVTTSHVTKTVTVTLMCLLLNVINIVPTSHVIRVITCNVPLTQCEKDCVNKSCDQDPYCNVPLTQFDKRLCPLAMWQKSTSHVTKTVIAMCFLLNVTMIVSKGHLTRTLTVMCLFLNMSKIVLIGHVTTTFCKMFPTHNVTRIRRKAVSQLLTEVWQSLECEKKVKVTRSEYSNRMPRTITMQIYHWRVK